MPTELLSVATMSARNSGLSAWRSALRATSDNWLTRFFDIVQDEGEAAVEFLEPLGVRQCFLTERFGERTRGLAAGRAQQVEIFPV